jgi:hypothetical protein
MTQQMPTGRVLKEQGTLTEPWHAYLALIVVLTKKIAELEARIAALE